MKYYLTHLLILFCLFFVISCFTEPSSIDNPAPEPNPETNVLKYSREYWGEWKKMDQSETWLINSTSISINGVESSRTATLAKPSTNVISVTENGQTYCLYAVRTASSTISGSITAQETSKDLGAIYKIVAQNIRDANDVAETTSDDEGNFNVDDLIVGEEYNVRIGDTSLNVKPSFDGENIGNITLRSGVNFKVTLSNTNDVMYAGSQYYSINLIIENIGDTNCTAATYSLVGDDGVEVINNYADGVLLRTVAVGEKKTIPLRVRCDVPESETVIKKLNLTITDKDGTTWNDSVSLKFYRDTVTINVVSENGRPISGVIIGDGRTYSISNRTNYSITVPVTAESYLLVFSGAIANAARNTEAAYSIGVNRSATAAASLLAELGTGTNSFEPNDDENHAKPITFGKSVVSYLFENDIDYYYLEPVHLWDEGEVTKEATCTENGSTTYTCTVCGETSDEIIPATGHTFSSDWSNDADYHWHAASCGHDVVDGKSLHSWDDGTITNQASCTETGIITYTCTVCGQTKTEIIPVVPHQWTEGVVVISATHTTDGLMRFECTVCGATREETLPALVDAHTFSDAWTIDSEYHWHESTCGHSIVNGKAAHSWIEEVLVDPTYTSEGLIKYTCTVCDQTKTEAIPVLQYKIGDIGPAGGYVFYDCDADNDIGNADGLISTECGWRFLETAPNGLRVVDGVPSVDNPIEDYSYYSSEYNIPFGYYRLSEEGNCVYTNGTLQYNASNCTKTEVGFGKMNTELLIKTMGETAYTDSGSTSLYAARLCDLLEYTKDGKTFDDWFLPSRDELFLALTNLNWYTTGPSYEVLYWSSSEVENGTYYTGVGEAQVAWMVIFADLSSDESPSLNARHALRRVLPIRAFLPDEPHGHQFESVVTKQNTCDDSGIITYTCSSCGFSYDRTLPATGHSFNTEWTTDESHHWHSATCEHDVKDGYAVHTFDHADVSKNGSEYTFTYTCSVCGYQKTTNTVTYGDIGPAGGFIFYDCDADNESGNGDGLISSETGWRFLEAAPSDIYLVDNELVLYPSGPDTEEFVDTFNSGFIRVEQQNIWLYTNGTQVYDPETCTIKAIGSGKRNTELLVGIRYSTYEVVYENATSLGRYYQNFDKAKNPSAEVCDRLVYGTYTDWYLPSYYELELLYSNLHQSGKGMFYSDYYWSSSEAGHGSRYAINFTEGINETMQNNYGTYSCGSRFRVRAIREF